MSSEKETSYKSEDDHKSIQISHIDSVVPTLEDIDKSVEARLRRKYDLRILPIAILIYLMAFIDRYAILSIIYEASN